MLCPEAAPCVGAGARSDSPVGEARPRFMWGECRWGSRPYTDTGLQPMPPSRRRLLPWPHSALASHRPSTCWDRSCARRPLKHTVSRKTCKDKAVSRVPSQRGRNKGELPWHLGAWCFLGALWQQAAKRSCCLEASIHTPTWIAVYFFKALEMCKMLRTNRGGLRC